MKYIEWNVWRIECIVCCAIEPISYYMYILYSYYVSYTCIEKLVGWLISQYRESIKSIRVPKCNIL